MPWHKTKERTKAIFNTVRNLQHTLEMHECTSVYGLPNSHLVVLRGPLESEMQHTELLSDLVLEQK